MTSEPRTATARVATSKASGYLQQLCKHFGHRVPARFDAAAGVVSLPAGECTLEAAPDALTLRVAAATPDGLEELKRIVGGHLERFAFREELRVAWTAP